MDKYNSLLNVICANEHFYDDNDLAKKFKRAYESIPETNMVHHEWSDTIIKRRVKDYCKRNNIKIENYNGPLPFRAFLIPINNGKA